MIAYYTDILEPLYVLSKECQRRCLTMGSLSMALESCKISLTELSELNPMEEDYIDESSNSMIMETN